MREKGFALPLVLVLVAVGVVIVGIVAYFQLIPKLTPPTQVSQPTPTPTPIDETANWKEYTNKEMGFFIKHPRDFMIDEFPGAPVIYKGEKLDLPPPNDPYPIAIAVYARSGKDAREACFKEICQNLKNPAVGNTYKLEDIKINNASGVKLTSMLRNLAGDYYLGSADEGKIVRISYGTFRSPTDKRTENQMFEDFKLLEKVLSTFKFLD